MESHEILDDAVHNILRAVLERKEGYKKASQYVDDDELSELFESYAKQSEDFALELVPYSQKVETDLVGSQSFSDAWKLWMDMKSALTSGDKKELLDSCIAGEVAVIDKYYEIIDEQSLPDDLFNLVDQQREKIEEACENIRMQLNAA